MNNNVQDLINDEEGFDPSSIIGPKPEDEEGGSEMVRLSKLLPEELSNKLKRSNTERELRKPKKSKRRKLTPSYSFSRPQFSSRGRRRARDRKKRIFETMRKVLPALKFFSSHSDQQDLSSGLSKLRDNLRGLPHASDNIRAIRESEQEHKIYYLPKPLPGPVDFIKDNMLSALSVFLINLPLCMAFAAAGNLDPSIGIMSAFYCSIFIFFSDSKYSIISVPMSIALLSAPLVNSYGEIGYNVAIFVAGLIIMVSLHTKIYKYMIIIPKCVMDGFMNGGLFSIFAGHMAIVFGVKVDYTKMTSNQDILKDQLIFGLGQVYQQFQEINWLSLVLYVTIIVTLCYLMEYYPRQPWVLYIFVTGLFIGLVEENIFNPTNKMVRLSEQYPNMVFRVISFPEIRISSVAEMLMSPQFWVDSASMALFIMLESMICWGMMSIGTTQPYTSNARNMMVLIYSNLSSLVTGSMGCGFVFERSFTNFETGAENQWACFFQGAFCLVGGYLLFNLFDHIPSIVLEAILMGIEIKTVRLDEMIFTSKNDPKLFISNIVVTIVMFFERPSISIFVGIFVYLAMFSKELMVPKKEIMHGSIKADDIESSTKAFTAASKFRI